MIEIKKFESEILTENEKYQSQYSNAELINEKYMKGETRLVTEQARYPLPTLNELFSKGNAYELQPDFQRRKGRWSIEKKSKLIESFIINVPVPPVFLYEVSYANYEVMDGLQRISTIIDYYNDKFELAGLIQWSELNGMKYSQLPDKIKEGIDRRYLSSIILLNESASDLEKAMQMKQLVFERLNTGGEMLSGQEIRNAIYNGKMNDRCIKLSDNVIFKRLWGLKNDNASADEKDPLYRNMGDVELVLRFFAMRFVDKFTGKLDIFLDNYLKSANMFPEKTLDMLEEQFLRNIAVAYHLLGDKAFKIYKHRYVSLDWSSDAQRTVYDPMMIALTQLQLTDAEIETSNKIELVKKLEKFYEDHEDDFDGKKQSRSDIQHRAEILYNFLSSCFNRKV